MEETPNTLSLWEGIFTGGPIIVALHLCMVIGFGIAVGLAFRRSGSVLAFACSVLPFACGAFAMWVGILGYISIFPSFFSGLYDGDAVEGLHLLQRPFFIGTGLSVVALIVHSIARALSRNARNS